MSSHIMKYKTVATHTSKSHKLSSKGERRYHVPRIKYNIMRIKDNIMRMKYNIMRIMRKK